MTWVFFSLRTLLLLAMTATGATVVRQAHPTSGYLLTAAGAFELLSTCCWRGIHLATDGPYPAGVLYIGLRILGELTMAISVGLIVAALVTLANRIAARRKESAGGAQPQPPAPSAF